MNSTELKTKLTTHGLGHLFDKLQPFIRNSIRLYQQKCDESRLAIGQTKIGGKPDLPPAINWVTETNLIQSKEKRFIFFTRKKEELITKSLSFIAQINLHETATYDKENLLPKSGMLYFFYSADQEAWGLDYADKNKFSVLYWDGSITELMRTEYPEDLPVYSRYKPCSLNFESTISLPSYEHQVYNDLTAAEENTFWEHVYNDENINKLLGYADPLQNDMELECELVTHGIYCGDSSGFTNPRAKTLQPNAKNWRLLLQVDSNDENGMMWGDVGRLYFWIKKDDLLNKNFDKSWFSVQCC